jgi:mannose-6-phosphate isomerase-like protein (cupin superfamily)
MSYFVNKKQAQSVSAKENFSYPMLDESNGCVAGFKAGISVVTALEYSTPGVHQDQEGFVVLEGRGWAKIGAEECALEPEMCFIAPAGVPHSIKRDPGSAYVKVCWFHGAIA